MSLWSILGIESTSDITAIKRAYSKQLRIYHPEDDPEGYQRLREAYDRAIKLAKTGQIVPHILLMDEIMDEVGENEQEEHEPGGVEEIVEQELVEPHQALDPALRIERSYLPDNAERISSYQRVNSFMKQVEELYLRAEERYQVERWEVLLHDDMLWNIEINQMINASMISFLEKHRCLPLSVWHLLDQTFHWTEQITREAMPDSLVDMTWHSYLLRQLKQKYELRYIHLPPHIDIEGFWKYRQMALFALQENKPDLQREYAEKAYIIYSDDPDILRMLAEHHIIECNYVQAMAFAQQWLDTVPNDVDAYLCRAQLQYNQRWYDRAVEDCGYVLSQDPTHPQASYLLARCYMKLTRWAEAQGLLQSICLASPEDSRAVTLLIIVKRQVDLINSPEYQSRIDRQRRMDVQREKWLRIKSNTGRCISACFILIFLFMGVLFLLIDNVNKLAAVNQESMKNKNSFERVWTSPQIWDTEAGTRTRMEFTQAHFIGVLRYHDIETKGFEIEQYQSFRDIKGTEEQLREKKYVSIGYLRDTIVLLVTTYDEVEQILRKLPIQLTGKMRDMPYSKQLYEDVRNKYAAYEISKFSYLIQYGKYLDTTSEGDDSNLTWHNRYLYYSCLCFIILGVIAFFIYRKTRRILYSQMNHGMRGGA